LVSNNWDLGIGHVVDICFDKTFDQSESYENKSLKGFTIDY